jgi:hypothetical protein
MNDASLPWPHWMLRYVGSDDETALWDLVLSVDGSPAWGGVSDEAAAAIGELIQDYQGPGTAPSESYAAVLRLLPRGSDRAQTVETFRCADLILSDPEAYDRAPVDRGLLLARELSHAGAEASFLSFEAEWHIFRGDDASAALALTRTALDMFLGLAEDDEVYTKRVHLSAANTVSLTARTGDLPGARTLLVDLADVMDAEVLENLRQALRRAQ